MEQLCWQNNGDHSRKRILRMYDEIILQAKESLANKMITQPDAEFSEITIPVLYVKFFRKATKGIKLIKRIMQK